MSEKPTGGPAFPHDYTEQIESGLQAGHTRSRTYSVHGMTLRDYFAAKALVAIAQGHIDDCSAGQYDPDEIADTSYIIADSMLKARDK